MKHYDNKETEKVKNNSKIVDSFNNAINGIVESVNTERNMLFHMAVAVVVFLSAFILDFTRLELIVIGLTVVFVLMAELFNTAIEVLTDLTTEGKYHELAKKTKDISAGAVLLSAVASLFVAYLLIYPKVKAFIITREFNIRGMENQEHLAIISVITVVLLVILLKGIFYKKDTTHLFGGSVSGHAAIGFNLATIGSILSNSYVTIIVCYLLAALVAESRYEAKIHTIPEIIWGAILGTGVSLLLFWNFI